MELHFATVHGKIDITFQSKGTKVYLTARTLMVEDLEV